MANSEKYKMTISLNILNHLGINLYSNIPAVLSEVVANSWDADAETVEITIDDKNNEIIPNCKETGNLLTITSQTGSS